MSRESGSEGHPREQTGKRGFFAKLFKGKQKADEETRKSDPVPSGEEGTEVSKGPQPRETAVDETSGGGFLEKLKRGLKKTRGNLSGLGGLFQRRIDEDLLEEVEELLIGSDIGVGTAMEVLEKIRTEVDRETLSDGVQLKRRLKEELTGILAKVPQRGLADRSPPVVMLVVGVNGVGKTTTIGKIARHLQSEGKSVTICAADTFRAAAVEQLQVWAQRAGVDIVVKPESKDPAAVVFDALQRIKEKQGDVLLIDTAGRLHNNPGLMNELDKIRRIIGKSIADAPHHVILILDAVTGQNGLQQAKQFVSKVGVTDLVITKLDGTAKGGIAIAIAKELKLPIQYIGVGEGMDDLLPFDREAFVDSLFSDA